MIKKTITLFALIILSAPTFSQTYFENREDIPEKYTWDMTPIFDDWNQWKENYKETEKLVEAFVVRDTFKTATELYETLYSLDTLNNRIQKLSTYAMMLSHVNQRDEFASNQSYEAMVLDYDLRYKTAWISPCIKKLNPDSVNRWFKEIPKLMDYEFQYKADLRDKDHVIAEEKENTISRFEYAFYSFEDAYDALINLDNKAPKIVIEDTALTLNSTKYFNILRNDKNRTVRKQAYQAMSKKYNSNKNTIANLMKGAAYMQFAYAQSYNYNSTLEYHIDSDSIPTKLYSDLIETLKKESKPLQKYHQLRAKAMKLEDYSASDMRFNIFAPNVKYNIEKAKQLIENSVKPLGEEYLTKSTESLNNRTIDYFENKDKLTSVAYTTYCYGTPPFILTTYGNGLKDVYDLIHELGHGVHAIYSMEKQPISTYESTIFIDEITSTFNELLLTDYLLNQWESKENRLYLLEIAINNIEYYYKSAIKADFALQTYTNIEDDEDVTASTLDKLYVDIYTGFYGKTINNIDSSSWCSYGILDFYDYQYVSSITASLNFHDKIKGEESEKWIESYISLLESGSNDFPLNQLRKSGIDLLDKDNYSAISNYLTILVDLYEKELKNNGLIN
nr:M3 family metallopeptidase [uncultured Draconibacterium sp.]